MELMFQTQLTDLLHLNGKFWYQIGVLYGFPINIIRLTAGKVAMVVASKDAEVVTRWNETTYKKILSIIIITMLWKMLNTKEIDKNKRKRIGKENTMAVVLAVERTTEGVVVPIEY